MILMTIKDNKAGRFFEPRQYDTQAEGLRAFEAGVNGNGGLLHEYPEDCEVYSLGEYDHRTGLISPDLQFVCSAISLKREKEVKNG